ncbi:hypothetical protein P1J78_20880 [Psychromarinibacter sp. C21-152]|uniref:Uncharacterized protein n=1 Tax=Psychromarinibacter sediminicola TaxID=3033385 RepID=A0AAE3TAF4_9RHOB|nr:hypothetical protein [Psychromarinibacter sediminicola]MDF0603202.1 hypothetical protein [Psychromarinibacter sediminicola]
MNQDQHHFDTAVRGVLSQGGPSGSPGFCKYRDGDRRCAVGWLIPDEAYVPMIEGFSVAEYTVYQLIPGPKIPNVALLSQLQSAHDNAASTDDFITDFKNQARNIANGFGLNTEVLDHV